MVHYPLATVIFSEAIFLEPAIFNPDIAISGLTHYATPTGYFVTEIIIPLFFSDFFH